MALVMRSLGASPAATAHRSARRRPVTCVALFQSQPGPSSTPEPPVVAKLPLPKGVTAPSRLPTKEPLTFGFVSWAEKINGRAAMLGFFGTLLVELILQRGVLEAAGFKVGNGLGFEF